MTFQITVYQGTITEDAEIISLLNSVFVGEDYTDKSSAEKMFIISEIQKRGEIILARSNTKLVGMIIFVPNTSPACQVAKPDEAEIHLLAVSPEARNQGIASGLISECEKNAVSSGYSKMVLSTQQTMKAAHHVYEKLDYLRNPARDWSRSNKLYYVYEKLLK